jgi:hypothetical protein
VLCSTAVDAARNGGSGSQAHSSHVGGWPPSFSACWTPTTPTLASSPSVQPTFHRAPSAVVVETCSEGPSHERMPTCVSTAHLHQPRHPRRRMAIQDLGVLSAHPRTRGRMPTRVRIPPHLHSPSCPAYHLVQREGIQGLSSTPAPRRDHAPCAQVTRDSPSNPCITSRATAG